LMVFAWWSGNGDMHLKNFSVFTDAQGVVQLTPAYDLVCTRLVIANDPLALPITGKRDNLDRDDWLKFAEYCRLPAKTAQRVLETQRSVTDAAAELIDRCFLPTDLKLVLKELTAVRSVQLG
jgi:serine/threonine-protein kinase HipA